ncbi:hypothetical protein [Haloactinomyces albus]|uniref:Uncharacterized protein n=1 Tax=Haloactinomyces albus TaxID=1352928 RepID=A0AAE3ZHU4_9ACTN|nr:hypothetical protein [Haloactinomyces albus]MDR7303209.1 hypothetical protein [Haloactinomyces albus]
MIPAATREETTSARCAPEQRGPEQGDTETGVRYVRYRRGEVGESRRSIHVAMCMPDGLLASACGQTFQPGRMEDTTRGMPCLTCVHRLASAERTRASTRLVDEHGEHGLPR